MKGTMSPLYLADCPSLPDFTQIKSWCQFGDLAPKSTMPSYVVKFCLGLVFRIFLTWADPEGGGGAGGRTP